ncbi:MAG: taurine dioxygenase [Rhodospirillaceae bacterium]|nr:taurine dioxygenase [Rhodospirillaceae bacterium]|tara:strand:+ start:1090 stop:1947 length:858 start_codon:yes stop_codon:yes gene_type:complete
MKPKLIEVQPVSGNIGAIISNVDLSNLDDKTFDEIYKAWLKYCVIFFRNQKITPEEQIAFAKRFGEIHFHPYMRGLDEFPEILEIIKEPGDSYTFGSVWHTDQMFNPQPAKATMLYAREVPKLGGDTQFSNQHLAYESLSDEMKNMLKGIKTYNVGDGFRRGVGKVKRIDRYANNPTMQAKIRDPGNLPTESIHPLIRTHPETGRKSLYIGSHTQSFHGFHDKEADPLVDFLRAHSTRPEFTCRFRWDVGSLALWDNRSVLHQALADYDERRRMHRITIAGDTPF